jgi:hypothetical protein
MGVWSFMFDRGGSPAAPPVTPQMLRSVRIPLTDRCWFAQAGSSFRKKPGTSANLALQEERASRGRAAGTRFLS